MQIGCNAPHHSSSSTLPAPRTPYPGATSRPKDSKLNLRQRLLMYLPPCKGLLLKEQFSWLAA
eukprot:5749145-Amphidinium_carterae.1